MSSRQILNNRLYCTVPGCPVSVGRKADLLRHQEEKHGETKFCTVPGCDYEGTKRLSRLKSHVEKRHPGMTSVELFVPESETSASQHPEERDYTQESYNAYSGAGNYLPYSTSSAQGGQESASSAMTKTWNPTGYNSQELTNYQQQPSQWSTVPQYQTQYQTEGTQTYNTEGYLEPAYQTAPSTTYHSSTNDSEGSNVNRGYTGGQWDEEPRYTTY